MSEKKTIPNGRPWPKGVSGNPGGVPKGIRRQIHEKHAGDAVTIVGIMVALAKGEDVPGYSHVRNADRIRAGEVALDRIIGKPKVFVDVKPVATRVKADTSGLSVEKKRELLRSYEEMLALAAVQGVEASEETETDVEPPMLTEH